MKCKMIYYAKCCVVIMKYEGIKIDLLYLTHKGQKLSVDQLKSNLRSIVEKVIQDIPDEEAGTPQSSSSHEHIDKEQQTSELKNNFCPSCLLLKRDVKVHFQGTELYKKEYAICSLSLKGVV